MDCNCTGNIKPLLNLSSSTAGVTATLANRPDPGDNVQALLSSTSLHLPALGPFSVPIFNTSGSPTTSLGHQQQQPLVQEYQDVTSAARPARPPASAPSARGTIPRAVYDTSYTGHPLCRRRPRRGRRAVERHSLRRSPARPPEARPPCSCLVQEYRGSNHTQPLLCSSRTIGGKGHLCVHVSINRTRKVSKKVGRRGDLIQRSVISVLFSAGSALRASAHFLNPLLRLTVC
jgi:hypothetical protein